MVLILSFESSFSPTPPQTRITPQAPGDNRRMKGSKVYSSAPDHGQSSRGRAGGPGDDSPVTHTVHGVLVRGFHVRGRLVQQGAGPWTCLFCFPSGDPTAGSLMCSAGGTG